MKVSFFLSISVLSLLCGCAQNARVYEPIAQHTLKVNADTETDVVWVQRFDSNSNQTHLLRCGGAPTAPKCDEAKVP
jgi:hypothetical protein